MLLQVTLSCIALDRPFLLVEAKRMSCLAGSAEDCPYYLSKVVR